MGFIYTRGQVTCDTSLPAIHIPLVGQDTKPRLSERAGRHVARYSEQVLNSEILRSAAERVFRPGVSHCLVHVVHTETRISAVILVCEYD